MNVPVEPPRHRTYVLHLWREHAAQPDRSAEWRFSVEEPCTGQRRGFASMRALTDFIETTLTCDEGRVE
jgi:hypothetical protein